MNTSYRSAIAVAAADLIFSARIRGAAQHVGLQTLFARNEAELLAAAAQARLVIVDLDTRWIDVARIISALKGHEQTRHVPVVAFAAHVHTEALEAARTAGADRVLARSAFVRLLPELLAGAD